MVGVCVMCLYEKYTKILDIVYVSEHNGKQRRDDPNAVMFPKATYPNPSRKHGRHM